MINQPKQVRLNDKCNTVITIKDIAELELCQASGTTTLCTIAGKVMTPPPCQEPARRAMSHIAMRRHGWDVLFLYFYSSSGEASIDYAAIRNIVNHEKTCHKNSISNVLDA